MTGELAAGGQSRYEARGAELDSLRVSAMRLERLSPEQPARLEAIRRMEEAAEARIAVARVDDAVALSAA